MHAKKSRKKELTRRIFIYGIMTATMLVLLVILTYRILGYQFNFSTKTVEQTGLVQYDSFPRGAMVNVDGRNFETTRTKNSVLPGSHQFSMSLKGYEDWQKTLEIKAGTVTWLSYVRLVPTQKKVVDVQDIGEATGALTSNDKRFMAILRKNTAANELALIDVRDSRQPQLTSFSLDTTDLVGYNETTGEDKTITHEFELVKWDKSDRRILIKHKFSGSISGEEWVVFDRQQGGRLINLSKLTNLNLVDVQPGKDGEMYVLQDNGDVRRLVVESGELTRPIISNVSSFGVYNQSTIYYISVQSEAENAGVWKEGWSNPVVFRSLPKQAESEPTLHIAVSEYFSQSTVAISEGSKVTIYQGTLPANNHDKAIFLQQPVDDFTLNRPLDSLKISDNGRFIIVEDYQGFVSYDLELNHISQQIKKYHSGDIKWLDPYHVWQINDTGKLVMQEFDGINTQVLVPATTGFDVLLTSDSKYLYYLRQNPETKAVALERMSMTIDN